MPWYLIIAIVIIFKVYSWNYIPKVILFLLVTMDINKPVPVIVSVSKLKLSLKLLFHLYIC